MSAEPPQNGSGGGESAATMGVSALVIVLAVVSVVFRFYTRIFTRVGLGWDDWLIMVAVVLTLVTAGLLLWGNGVDPNGQWVADNTDPSYVYTPQDSFYLKLSYITSVLYFSIAGATKLGILVMYHRIFSVGKSFRYQLIAAGILVIAFWVGCTVANLTNCIPLEWSWINGLADPRYCFNYNIFWMAAGACEIVLDVIILTLPVRATMRLQLSLHKKISVASIFLLGGFVVVTGMVKTILGYPPGSRVPSYSKTEVWTTVHTGMSIVCANLPILRPLVRRITGWSWLSKLSSLLKTRRMSSGGSRSPATSPVEIKDSLASSTDIEDKTVSMIAVEEGRAVSPEQRRATLERGWSEYRFDSSPTIAEEIAETLSEGYGMDIQTQRRRSKLTSFVFVPSSEETLSNTPPG